MDKYISCTNSKGSLIGPPLIQYRVGVNWREGGLKEGGLIKFLGPRGGGLLEGAGLKRGRGLIRGNTVMC